MITVEARSLFFYKNYISDNYEGTKLNEGLNQRLLQAHLERLSDYLECGEGVWWHIEGMYIVFHDADCDPDFR